MKTNKSSKREYECQCGTWGGDECQAFGFAHEMRTVEYQAVAGQWVRLYVHKNCAGLMVEVDGDDVEVIS